MSTPTIKDRVFEAADQVAAERNPTVATVREVAGVSNSDATRYLKEWRAARAAASSPVISLPPALEEQALILAGTMWTQASALSAAHHLALEVVWREEKAQQDQDLAELVRDLDAANSEAAQSVQRHATELHELEAKLAAAQTHEAAAQAAVAVHEEAEGALATQLAAAQATIRTLEATQASLLRGPRALRPRGSASSPAALRRPFGA